MAAIHTFGVEGSYAIYGHSDKKGRVKMTTMSSRSKQSGAAVHMTIQSSRRPVTGRAYVKGIIMAGFTKSAPFTPLSHDADIHSIDSGPQKPLIWGAMGFMAVRVGKDIIGVLDVIRG